MDNYSKIFLAMPWNALTIKIQKVWKEILSSMFVSLWYLITVLSFSTIVFFLSGETNEETNKIKIVFEYLTVFLR